MRVRPWSALAETGISLAVSLIRAVSTELATRAALAVFGAVFPACHALATCAVTLAAPKAQPSRTRTCVHQFSATEPDLNRPAPYSLSRETM